MEKLTQAIDLIKSGEKARGKRLLTEIIRTNPQNERAWLWMTLVVDTQEQRRECLERVLAINPDNARARAGLAKITGQTPPIGHSQPIEVATSTPAIDGPKTESGLFEAGNFGTPAEPAADVERALQVRLANLQREQNYLLGVIGGLIGGITGALLWAAITIAIDYQIGFMAMGVGFMVGYGMRFLGRGIDKIYGITGGAIALFSVALGNFLFAIGILAEVWEVSYIEALWSFNYAMTLELMTVTFSPMDIIFYLIAIYEGYRFSFRKLSSDDLGFSQE